jgi:hypothetical protein
MKPCPIRADTQAKIAVDPNGSVRSKSFDPELQFCSSVPSSSMDEKIYASATMNDAEKFRQYAAECRRLARTAAAKDKAVLLEIANAWIACAEEADRKAKNAERS